MHKTKHSSDLPQIINFSPQHSKKGSYVFNPVRQIQNKSSVMNQFHDESIILSNVSNCSRKPMKRSTFQPKVNCTSPLKRLPPSNNSNQQWTMPQKLLGKNKKYYRIDAQMRTKQHSIKSDIQCLIENLVKDKEKNDFIVLNLRDKFKKDQRSLTINKHNSALIMRKGRLTSSLAQQAQHHHNVSANQPQQQQPRECPISSVNEFNKTVSSNKISVFKLNHQTQDLLVQGAMFNKQVKSLKQILRQYIHNYRSSPNLKEKLLNNSSSYTRGTNINHNNSTLLSHSKPKKYTTMSHSTHIQKNNINNKKVGNAYFNQFIQLTEKSYDYLECFLKSSFITDPSQSSISQHDERSSNILQQTRLEIDSMLKKMDKNAILSVLKSSHTCLQPAHNQKQIINRILLALNINPMNQFHFIKQETFIKFKKLSTSQASRKDSRDFLLKYFCLQNDSIKKQHFQNMIFSVFRKLVPLTNQSTVQMLYDRMRKVTRHMIVEARRELNQKGSDNNSNKENQMRVTQQDNSKGVRLSLDCEFEKNQQAKEKTPLSKINHPTVKQDQEYYLKSQIKSILVNDPLGLWDQFLQLIFIV